jgi:thiol:disulfide interchange protein DsbC
MLSLKVLKLKKLGFIGLSALVFGLSFAQNVASAATSHDSSGDKTVDNIKNVLKLELPELNVNSINPTQIPNLYEVVSGHKVFYVDSTGRYAILGNLVDLKEKESITQKQVQKLSTINWDDLPIKIALRKVIGDGSRKIAIFTDPQCPFCQRLEQDTVPNLKNVTIYYFLYPLPNHEYAKTYSMQILCSEMPEKNFSAWMKNKTTLPTKSKCDKSSVLEQMIKVGHDVVQVDATPTIVLPDGSIVTGLIPPDYLNKLIDDTSGVQQPPATDAEMAASNNASAPKAKSNNQSSAPIVIKAK